MRYNDYKNKPLRIIKQIGAVACIALICIPAGMAVAGLVIKNNQLYSQGALALGLETSSVDQISAALREQKLQRKAGLMKGIDVPSEAVMQELMQHKLASISNAELDTETAYFVFELTIRLLNQSDHEKSELKALLALEYLQASAVAGLPPAAAKWDALHAEGSDLEFVSQTLLDSSIYSPPLAAALLQRATMQQEVALRRVESSVYQCLLELRFWQCTKPFTRQDLIGEIKL